MLKIMDLFGDLYVPNFLLVTFAVILSIYFYGRRSFGIFAEYGIKGPKPTAFLGNLKEMGQTGFEKVFFDWQKEFGDIYSIFFGMTPNLVITNPEMIGEIMVKSFSNFTNRPMSFTVDKYSASMLNIAKDGHWKYLRTVLAPSYSSKRMREMVPLIENVLKIFEKNLNKIADSKEATDVTILFSGYTMDIIASTGFGIQVDSQENPDSPVVKNGRKIFETEFLQSVKMSFTMDVIASTGFGIQVDSQENPDSPVVKNGRKIFAGNILKSVMALLIIFPIFSNIVNKFKPGMVFGDMSYYLDFCKELVEERKKEKNSSTRKDLLQLMLDAQLEGHEKLNGRTEQELELKSITDWRTKRGLTDVEIIAQCMVFFVAGFETTASTLSFFAHSIAMNPDVQEKLCQEIEEKLGQESPNYDNVQKLTYLDMCMDETLRMYPIALLLSRESKENCIIKGMKIPKNTPIMIPVMCLHFDPRFWTEPEQFDPEHFSEENKAKRKPFCYLPFGGGPRICAGMRLAELEFKMAVVQMLRKFRLVPCDKTEKTIEFSKGFLLKAKNGIWIKIEHR